MVCSNSFREKLRRNPEEILEIFWGNLEHLFWGASKLNPALEEWFIFCRLITPQLIRLMINRDGFNQLRLIGSNQLISSSRLKFGND